MGEEDKQKEPKVEEKQVEEEKGEDKDGKKKEEDGKKAEDGRKEEEANSSPSAPTVFYIDLHCVGCAKKIERSILRCRGVGSVDMDMGRNQVTVNGLVDPEMICSKIRKKTMREIKVLSPEEPNAVTSLRMSTEELHVNLHCEACAQQVRKIILKMRGVQKVETELSSGKVNVTGSMNADRLVEYVYRRTRKQAKILSQPPKGEEEEEEEKKKKEEEGAMKTEEKSVENQEKKEGERGVEENKDEEKKESEETKGGREEEKKEEEVGEVAPVGGGSLEDELNKKMMYWATPAIYDVEQTPLSQLFTYENSNSNSNSNEQTSLPQLFSDENPNACSIS